MTSAPFKWVLAAVALLLWVAGCGDGVAPERPDSQRPEVSSAAQGFLYEAPEQGILIQAEELYAEGVGMGGVRINLVQNLVLRPALIRLDVSDGRDQPDAHQIRESTIRDGLGAAVAIVRSANAGVTMRDAMVEIHRGSTLLHRISADEIRSTPRSFELEGSVRIESLRREVLEAEMAFWPYAGWEILVPGKFEVSRGADLQASQAGRFMMLMDGSLRVPADASPQSGAAGSGTRPPPSE